MGEPNNAGVEKQWLKALAQQDVKKPKTWTDKETKIITPKNPSSRMQTLFQEFYYALVDGLNDVRTRGGEVEGPDEDLFDGWFDENNLEKYSHTYKMSQYFNTILKGLHLSTESGYGNKEQIQKQLSKITQRCIDEPEYVKKVAEIINGFGSTWKNIVTEFRSVPSTEEINEHEEEQYQRELDKIEDGIETNIDQYEEELAKIRRAKKTDFEKKAQELNTIIIVGEGIWELALYNIMSPTAPRIIINSIDQRSNLHMLLAGDISTAKSKILKIGKLIAPKMLILDETTKPSYEGIAKIGEGIQEGVLDQANDGTIIIEELTTRLTKMPLFRRGMDCERIVIHKMGEAKHIDVNTTLLTACNPQGDFFMDELEITFRKQIPFKEGVLSRFDILIPLTNTPVKNDILLGKMNLMSEENPFKDLDIDELRENLATLASGMRQIRRVVITEEQQELLKDAFRMKNDLDQRKKLLKNRPLVIFRDLETLARLVNTIASVNFSKRKIKDGVLEADDSDIEKAIQLWEELIQFRIQLYAKYDRNIKSISDEILMWMLRMSDKYDDNQVPVLELRQRVVDIEGICGQTTFYKLIKSLRERKAIVQRGQRNGTVSIVIS